MCSKIWSLGFSLYRINSAFQKVEHKLSKQDFSLLKGYDIYDTHMKNLSTLSLSVSLSLSHTHTHKMEEKQFWEIQQEKGKRTEDMQKDRNRKAGEEWWARRNVQKDKIMNIWSLKIISNKNVEFWIDKGARLSYAEKETVIPLKDGVIADKLVYRGALLLQIYLFLRTLCLICVWPGFKPYLQRNKGFMAPTKLPTIHCTMNKYICIRQILDPDGTAWIFEFEFNIPDRFLDIKFVFNKFDFI